MRLYYAPCGLEISIPEGGVSGICLENPKTMKAFIGSLWRQSQGEEGDIFISQRDKAVSLVKNTSVIFNPFSIDINERKILAKLLAEMQEIAETDLFVQKSELNAAIINFLDEINQRISYPLTYSIDLDIQQLFKLYAVKIDMQSTELSERIVDYMKMGHQILGIKLFVFWHIRDVLSVEELEKIYEMVAYEQTSVVLLESRMPKKMQQEKWWVVDADNSIIEI